MFDVSHIGNMSEVKAPSLNDIPREMPQVAQKKADELMNFWDGLRGEKFAVDSDKAESTEKEADALQLTEEDKAKIKEETGWSDKVVDAIETMEQYEIYKNADLVEMEVNGRPCLVKKDLDLDYVDPKTGRTNRELMEQGRSPYDSKTGEKIELHHMGQKYDAPFAQLAVKSEHGGHNYKILHTNDSPSWRNDPILKNHYNNVQRPNHWKELSKGVST